MCAYHGTLPAGMRPVPAPAFTAPYGPAPRAPKGRKLRKSRAKPRRESPLDRLSTATELLNGAARDYMKGVPGAWERVEAARSLVAGATLALHEWEGRETE